MTLLEAEPKRTSVLRGSPCTYQAHDEMSGVSKCPDRYMEPIAGVGLSPSSAGSIVRLLIHAKDRITSLASTGSVA